MMIRWFWNKRMKGLEQENKLLQEQVERLEKEKAQALNLIKHERAVMNEIREREIEKHRRDV